VDAQQFVPKLTTLKAKPSIKMPDLVAISYKNPFIYISASVAAFLMVLFYTDNSLIHFSNSPTQLLMQNSSAPTQLLPQKTQATTTTTTTTTTGVSGHVFSGKRIRTFTFTKQYLKQTTPSDILLTTSTCTRWGVVTTINAPTQSIYNVLNQTKLCLVIVADLKTPTKKYLALEEKHDTVTFLSVEDQKVMQDFEITSELPWNHFGRKNLGFVYAIQHGAKVVFDFDDDNELISNIPSMIKNQSWWVADNTQVFNPYPTFVNMADVAWPRGFPLTQIQNISTWKVPSYSTNNANIGVVQSLANHDPDMDAIWRLTRKLPLNFESNKRVVLPPGTYSSYNAQATIHYALWGMLLPVSVHGRVSDIWRSYIMQRLMHDVGQVIGFVSPFVKQVRNEHSYQGDYMSERPLYEKTEALIQVVSQWKGRSNKFEERFVELFVELYERNFIELKDVYLAQKWIRTLQQMKYQFPKIVNTPDTIIKRCISDWHDQEGKCEKNVCQCSGGEPVDECPEHNKNVCKSCINGLLIDGNCINVCKCTNGDVADVCPQHDENICKSCDEGFIKNEADQCVKNCVCDNGIAVAEDECPTNGAMKCKFCNCNYYLKNYTCHVHSLVCTSEQYQAQEPTGEQDRICKPTTTNTPTTAVDLDRIALKKFQQKFDFKRPLVDPASKSTSKGKIAVCISGSVRKANAVSVQSWMGNFGYILNQLNPTQKKSFQDWVSKKNPKPVDSIHKYLYPAMEDFDVFMTHNDNTNSGCDDYAPLLPPVIPPTQQNNSIHPTTGNNNEPQQPLHQPKLYCKYNPLYNPKPADIGMTEEIWSWAEKMYFPHGYFGGHFLGQLWDNALCAKMIETHEKKLNVKYDVVVRLRPDTMFFAPMPEISLQTTKICTLDIREYGGGGEDIFNVGRRDEMILFMKRIYDGQDVLESMMHAYFMKHSKGSAYPWFNAEVYVRYWWFNKCSSHNGELEFNHLYDDGTFSEVDRGDLRTHKDDWLFHVWHFNGE